MRFTIHRIRKLLEPLCEKLGRDVIVTEQGGYGWNPEIPVSLDTERFEGLLREAGRSEDADTVLERLLAALELYGSDFLARFTRQAWVLPVAAYYRELYFSAAREAGALLGERGRYREAAEICRGALRFDSFNEELSRQLMRALIGARDYAGVSEVYKELSRRLYDELGVKPDEETQAVYRDALKHMGDAAVSPEVIKAQLSEENPDGGALICDYAQFRRYYQAEARSAARRGDAVHIAILSVAGKSGAPLSRAVLRNTMDQLQDHIRNSLRMGDVAASCSASQFVLMLLQANFENSTKVLERMAAGFYRAHPHTAAFLQYVILPIEPLIERKGGKAL